MAIFFQIILDKVLKTLMCVDHAKANNVKLWNIRNFISFFSKYDLQTVQVIYIKNWEIEF